MITTNDNEYQLDAHIRRWANYNWFDLTDRYKKYQDTGVLNDK